MMIPLIDEFDLEELSMSTRIERERETQKKKKTIQDFKHTRMHTIDPDPELRMDHQQSTNTSRATSGKGNIIFSLFLSLFRAEI